MRKIRYCVYGKDIEILCHRERQHQKGFLLYLVEEYFGKDILLCLRKKILWQLCLRGKWCGKDAVALCLRKRYLRKDILSQGKILWCLSQEKIGAERHFVSGEDIVVFVSGKDCVVLVAGI